MTIKAACAQSNIGLRTYYDWIEKSGEDGEWTKEVEAAITLSEAVILDNIKKTTALKEDWRGWAWILERRFRERWGAKREVELNVNNPHKQSDEMFAAMVEQSNAAYARGLTHTEEEASDDEGES
jgi:hypothetical protein